MSRDKVKWVVAWCWILLAGAVLLWVAAGTISDSQAAPGAGKITIAQNESEIVISTSALEAAIRKQGYVSGVYQGTFLDKKTGFRDVGFGLDIVDWLSSRAVTRRTAPNSTRRWSITTATWLMATLPREAWKVPRFAPGKAACAGDHLGEGLRRGQAALHLLPLRPRVKSRARNGIRRLFFPPANGTSSPATGLTPSTPAMRCFCGSICLVISSTTTATRSARCT